MTEKLLDISAFTPQITTALGHAGDTHSVADVEAMIAAGRLQAWPGPASLIVTELIAFPNQTNLHFFLAVGNRQELAAMTPLVIDWAKEQGCTTATLIGRKGWLRMPFLRDSGWRQSPLVLMERDL